MAKQHSALTAESVQRVFTDCLFKTGENTPNLVTAEGVMGTVGFHPERLKSHREAIIAMLAELPDAFMASGGGGYSFLNACMDRNDNLWTGLHRTVEQLVQLGIAIGKVEYCLPRDMWSVLPGGMPYFVVKQ